MARTKRRRKLKSVAYQVFIDPHDGHVMVLTLSGQALGVAMPVWSRALMQYLYRLPMTPGLRFTTYPAAVRYLLIANGYDPNTSTEVPTR